MIRKARLRAIPIAVPVLILGAIGCASDESADKQEVIRLLEEASSQYQSSE